METYTKKEINGYQKEKFEEYERSSVVNFLTKYDVVLSNMPSGKTLKILDIGGGSGNFAVALHQHFTKNGYDAEVSVLDITRYSAWEQYSCCIHFIEGSSFEIEKRFEKETFDLVFVNRTFHHLIQSSYSKTIDGIKTLLCAIRQILKNEGILCVSECYYEILLFKGLSSWIIYNLSTINVPIIAKQLRKIGSKSAGVGVCFLSIKKWREITEQAAYEITHVIEEPKRFVRKLPIEEQFFYFVLRKKP
jgi:ubiquinone/menaquinone biosynthesis C-methylase UbiE